MSSAASMSNMSKLKYAFFGSVLGGGIYSGFTNYEKKMNDNKTPKAVLIRTILKKLKADLLTSASYAKFLLCCTGLDEIVGYRGKIRRFRPGLDYTVAHYGIFTERSVLDGTLCFVEGEGKQVLYDEGTGELVGGGEDEEWGGGGGGGFECYIAADEEEGAVDEYDPDDDSELLSVAASFNTMSLCYRNFGTMRFVKYVGSSAPGSRFDISLEYELNDYDDSGDEGEEGEEEGEGGEGSDGDN
ncbi:hypothetical protein TrVE_jg497 [Triparma verrucosa]|uniref:Oxoglutarate/iron-dependent oxygenase C-terminal degradation domain-containing protein n=1 Tax=Triparma verrucosa TaxID=1606542 RepID=A0A9W7BSU8_9STRA|nr:hypothetical protein TrVE_jg497 [Triparma verrucosa]